MSLLNTPFRDKPPRLSRSGAFIELPALNPPFRDNRGGLSRKGVPVPIPIPSPSRSRNPSIRDKPSRIPSWPFNTHLVKHPDTVHVLIDSSTDRTNYLIY